MKRPNRYLARTLHLQSEEPDWPKTPISALLRKSRAFHLANWTNVVQNWRIFAYYKKCYKYIISSGTPLPLYPEIAHLNIIEIQEIVDGALRLFLQSLVIPALVLILGLLGFIFQDYRKPNAPFRAAILVDEVQFQTAFDKTFGKQQDSFFFKQAFISNYTTTDSLLASDDFLILEPSDSSSSLQLKEFVVPRGVTLDLDKAAPKTLVIKTHKSSSSLTPSFQIAKIGRYGFYPSSEITTSYRPVATPIFNGPAFIGEGLTLQAQGLLAFELSSFPVHKVTFEESKEGEDLGNSTLVSGWICFSAQPKDTVHFDDTQTLQLSSPANANLNVRISNHSKGLLIRIEGTASSVESWQGPKAIPDQGNDIRPTYAFHWLGTLPDAALAIIGAVSAAILSVFIRILK